MLSALQFFLKMQKKKKSKARPYCGVQSSPSVLHKPSEALEAPGCHEAPLVKPPFLKGLPHPLLHRSVGNLRPPASPSSGQWEDSPEVLRMQYYPARLCCDFLRHGFSDQVSSTHPHGELGLGKVRLLLGLCLMSHFRPPQAASAWGPGS